MPAIERFRKSSSFKLALFFAILLVFAILVVGYFVNIVSDETLLRESEAAIDADIRMFEEAQSLQGIDYVIQIINHRSQRAANSYFYALRDAKRRMVAGNLAHWVEGVVHKERPDIILFELAHNELSMPNKSVRSFAEHYDIMAKLHRFGDGYEILVGRDVDDLEAAQWVASTFGWGVVAIMFLIAIIVFWVGVYLVRRINSISNTATQIMQTGDLSARIPVDTTWDDISKLAAVLNNMLDEIQSLMQGVRRVSDNIAHDLKTPLTRLRTDLEGVANDAQREELLKEADTLLCMFNGLLRIADIESEKQKSAFADLDMTQLVDDAAAFYKPLASEKNITLSTRFEPCRCHGDRDLLFQAFANVLDNAIKFTPQGGFVQVTLKRSEEGCDVSICDSGMGVSDVHKQKLFQRFFRVDESRHSPGYGLGLSLVSAIAALHDARIELEDNHPGLCFRVRFPG